jgi:hypothetical protein
LEMLSAAQACSASVPENQSTLSSVSSEWATSTSRMKP